MKDEIGALRARVMLQSPARTPDDLGGASLAWADEGEVWAELAPAGAGERIAYDTASAIVSYVLHIRARADVRAGWRVRMGLRAFRVLAVRDLAGARLDLICEEESL